MQYMKVMIFRNQIGVILLSINIIYLMWGCDNMLQDAESLNHLQY